MPATRSWDDPQGIAPASSAMPNRDGGATPDDPPPGDTQFDAYRSESATQDTVGGRPAIATVPAGNPPSYAGLW